MDEHLLGRLLGAALVPLFWLLALTLALWFVRRVFPRAERVLFDPIGTVIGRLGRQLRASRRRQ